MDNKLLVKTTLRGNMVKKFLDIKKELGVQNNAEVLRILINKEA